MKKTLVHRFQLKRIDKMTKLFILGLSFLPIASYAAEGVPVIPAPIDVLQIKNLSTTANRFNVGNTINTICPGSTIAGTQLKSRCDQLVRIGGAPISDQQINGILGQVTSEQTASQNTQALEMNNSALSDVSNRLNSIKCRQKMQGQSSKHSNSIPECGQAGMASSITLNGNRLVNKEAAGDEDFSRLGVYANANIGFGNRVATANAKGYKLDLHGTTLGVDYRFNDQFLLGTAFNYQNSRAGFLNNQGSLETDKFTGTLYASFFTGSGFFVDGIFSGSHQNYDSTRHIEYTVPGETINTDVRGKNNADEYNVAMTTGYNFRLANLTITPQIRVDYTTTQVDALDETGGEGWSMHINDQQFESLQTVPGLSLSYPVSLSWAVIMPTVRAEYVHEFNNDSRAIITHFAQDPSKNRFNIFTDSPDRDYINLNAGISAQFKYGISAFVNYETVQAHSYVNNHNFTGGVRFELPL
jgi:outer membrane autotransporter protein